MASLLALGALPGLAAAGAAGQFCGQPLVRDFRAPLMGLPPVVEMPESGALPFAPEGVVVNRVSSERHLVLAGDHPHYVIETLARPSVHLGWSVKAGVSQMVNGLAVPIAPEMTTVIGDLGIPATAREIAIPDLPAPGSYRVDLIFFDESGGLLGGYAEYLQALEPKFEVHLGADRRRVRSGGRLRVRIENLGTSPIGYGYPYGLERRKKGGSWVSIPTGPFLLPLFGLSAGTAGRCQVIRLAPKALPGLYRISKDVSAFPGPIGPKRFVVRARFRVFSGHD